MDWTMELYWKMYFDKFTNEKLLDNFKNPITEFENEFIESSIIDIGCGQSEILLYLSKTGKEIYAVDNEKFQLNLLKKRVLKMNNVNIDKWHFIHKSFPNDKIPTQKYSIIILSNILHFFSIHDCLKLKDEIDKYSTAGTIIYIEVHSIEHSQNDPNNPDNNEYFKHYFSIDDLQQIFPTNKYEYLSVKEEMKSQSEEEIALIESWRRLIYKEVKEHNPKQYRNILKDAGQTLEEIINEEMDYYKTPNGLIKLLIRKK